MSCWLRQRMFSSSSSTTSLNNTFLIYIWNMFNSCSFDIEDFFIITWSNKTSECEWSDFFFLSSFFAVCHYYLNTSVNVFHPMIMTNNDQMFVFERKKNVFVIFFSPIINKEIIKMNTDVNEKSKQQRKSIYYHANIFERIFSLSENWY